MAVGFSRQERRCSFAKVIITADSSSDALKEFRESSAEVFVSSIVLLSGAEIPDSFL
jgi:hypothetical protein